MTRNGSNQTSNSPGKRPAAGASARPRSSAPKAARSARSHKKCSVVAQDDDAKDIRETVVYDRDGCRKLELMAVGGVVWMTMQQIGELFDVDRSVIGKHIRNVYASGELTREATWAKIAQVQIEGVRQVTRNIEYYSLDMIIAVGYRVNSLKATRFRMWATDVLKRYLTQGSAMNERFSKLEGRMSTVERAIDSIIYTLTPTLPENRTPIGFHP